MLHRFESQMRWFLVVGSLGIFSAGRFSETILKHSMGWDFGFHSFWIFFRMCPPERSPPPPPPSPVTEHAPLHGKSLCENIAPVSGGANNVHPLSWGGDAQTEKIRIFIQIRAIIDIN